MEEDVLGPRTQVIKRRYARCDKCGRTFLSRAPTPAGTLMPGEVRTESEALCPTCRDVLPTDQAIVDLDAEESP
jgi:hypothetical protein